MSTSTTGAGAGATMKHLNPMGEYVVSDNEGTIVAAG
jgi:hypothetical protein